VLLELRTISYIFGAAGGTDEVPAEQLIEAVMALQHASLEDHLRITFELLDTHGDGTINCDNMQEILKVGFALPNTNLVKVSLAI
jgi:Ca2+-binding EF-hand superfamily protein